MKKVFTPENMGHVCGECVYFLAGAGCRKYGACIRFDTFATFCEDFVDVDTVME